MNRLIRDDLKSKFVQKISVNLLERTNANCRDEIVI